MDLRNHDGYTDLLLSFNEEFSNIRKNAKSFPMYNFWCVMQVFYCMYIVCTCMQYIDMRRAELNEARNQFEESRTLTELYNVNTIIDLKRKIQHNSAGNFDLYLQVQVFLNLEENEKHPFTIA